MNLDQKIYFSLLVTATLYIGVSVTESVKFQESLRKRIITF